MGFGVVPSKNGNRCPRKSGNDYLLCLTLCHSALRVCCQKHVLLCFYVFSFPPGVYVGWTLNLFASIPGPSIFTSLSENVQYDQYYLPFNVFT